MASTSVPNMPAVGPISGPELLYVVQSGVDSKATAAQLDTYINSQFSGDAVVASNGVVTVSKTGGNLLGALATAATPLSTSLGGTGTTTPGLVAGANISVTGSWPNQTISGSSAIPNLSGSAQNTTGTISGSSITLAAALDFVNGQGIAVEHAGPAYSASAPSGLTVTPTGGTGSTTYTYQIAGVDANGGIGAALSAVSTATGYATLGTVLTATRAITCNHVTWTNGAGNVGYAVWRKIGSGSYILLGVFGAVAGGAASFYDVGTAAVSIPWIPATPNASSLAQRLVTTILSGAGTTALALGATATTSGSGLYVRHDDTAAVNTYLSGVTAAVFPAGTFNVESVTVPSTVLSFVGQGADSTVFNGWATAAATLIVSSTPYFLMRDISVEPVAYTNAGGLSVSSNYPTIARCVFGGAPAVLLSSCTGAKFVQNTIDNYFWTGLQATSCINCKISGNHVLVAPFIGAQAGYAMTVTGAGTTGCSVVDNQILGGQFWGIVLAGSNLKASTNVLINGIFEAIHVSQVANGIHISDNYIISSQSIDFGISVSDDQTSGLSPMVYVFIFNNTIITSGLASVSIFGYGNSTLLAYMSIIGNTFVQDNNTAPGPPYNSSVLLTGSNISGPSFVSNNTFLNIHTNSAYNVGEANINSQGVPAGTQVGTIFGTAGATGTTNLSGSGSAKLTGGTTGL